LEKESEDTKMLTIDGKRRNETNEQLYSIHKSPAKRAKNLEVPKQFTANERGGVVNFAEKVAHEFNFVHPKRPPTPMKPRQEPGLNQIDLENWDAEEQQKAPGSTHFPAPNLQPTPKVISDTSTPILNAKESEPLKPAIKRSEGRKLCPTFRKEQTIPKVCHLPLFGDDFFLRMAQHKLRPDTDGFCASGMTIREAVGLVFTSEELKNYNMIVVNIGNEDIIRNHNLLDMIEDYTIFLLECKSRGIETILTTLVPILGLHQEQRENLMKLNNWIRKHRHIDLFPVTLNDKKETDFGLYHGKKIYVSGSRRPRRFWNSQGEHKVLAKLQHALIKSLVN
jgi:hypothetical protein